MKKQIANSEEYYTVDSVYILKSLLRRVWVIALAGLLAAAIGFTISAVIIPQKYASSVMLYVNNSSFSLGNTSFSISSSEITAAQSLVKTYREILNNRTTLVRVIEKAEVPYTYRELSKMISAAPSNGTEIMKVTVTTTDPYEASKIANTIAEVLPNRISEIIDGASMEVVDAAVPVLRKVEPSVTKYTAVGLVLGIVLSTVLVVILAFLDDTIHDEDYVLQNYDYPLLGTVPDLLTGGNEKYGYYYARNKHNGQSTGAKGE